MTRGVPSPHIVCADLSRFLKEISETFIPLADSNKIVFTYSIAPDISIAYFDKNILEQVLYNLLSNAFKYTPDGGSVSFSALLEQSSSDAVMTLRITDSGIGIPPESLPYIFDQYIYAAIFLEDSQKNNKCVPHLLVVFLVLTVQAIPRLISK